VPRKRGGSRGRPSGHPGAAAPRSSRPDRTGEGLGSEIAERIAWSYLAALLAAVGAGIALAIGSTFVPRLCGADEAGTCEVGWTLLIGMLGYLLAILPASLVGGLGLWFALSYLAGYAGLMISGQLGEWWWWVALLLLPAVAATVSADWTGAGRPAVQRWLIGVAATIATAALIWWYLVAR
jgi:drug/metabolite transporter (DMT)-like permease